MKGKDVKLLNSNMRIKFKKKTFIKLYFIYWFGKIDTNLYINHKNLKIVWKVFNFNTTIRYRKYYNRFSTFLFYTKEDLIISKFGKDYLNNMMIKDFFNYYI